MRGENGGEDRRKLGEWALAPCTISRSWKFCKWPTGGDIRYSQRLSVKKWRSGGKSVFWGRFFVWKMDFFGGKIGENRSFGRWKFDFLLKYI